MFIWSLHFLKKQASPLPSLSCIAIQDTDSVLLFWEITRSNLEVTLPRDGWSPVLPDLAICYHLGCFLNHLATNILLLRLWVFKNLATFCSNFLAALTGHVGHSNGVKSSVHLTVPLWNAIWKPDVLSSFWMVDHLNNGQLKCLAFECFRYSNFKFSDFHCISEVGKDPYSCPQTLEKSPRKTNPKIQGV